MEQELISIVVPVYRAERYIEETMDCVRAQTYPHWELLLVEDCGPDRSREIIAVSYTHLTLPTKA